MVSAAQKGRLAGGTRTHDIRRLMQNRIAASAIRMTHDTSLYRLSYSQHNIQKGGARVGFEPTTTVLSGQENLLQAPMYGAHTCSTD